MSATQLAPNSPPLQSDNDQFVDVRDPSNDAGWADQERRTGIAQARKKIADAQANLNSSDAGLRERGRQDMEQAQDDLRFFGNIPVQSTASVKNYPAPSGGTPAANGTDVFDRAVTRMEQQQQGDVFDRAVDRMKQQQQGDVFDRAAARLSNEQLKQRSAQPTQFEKDRTSKGFLSTLGDASGVVPAFKSLAGDPLGTLGSMADRLVRAPVNIAQTIARTQPSPWDPTGGALTAAKNVLTPNADDFAQALNDGRLEDAAGLFVADVAPSLLGTPEGQAAVKATARVLKVSVKAPRFILPAALRKELLEAIKGSGPEAAAAIAKASQRGVTAAAVETGAAEESAPAAGRLITSAEEAAASAPRFQPGSFASWTKENLYNAARGGNRNAILELMRRGENLPPNASMIVGKGGIPKFHQGGIVKKTGPAMLEAGEYVIPRDRVPSAFAAEQAAAPANTNTQADLEKRFPQLRGLTAEDLARPGEKAKLTFALYNASKSSKTPLTISQAGRAALDYSNALATRGSRARVPQRVPQAQEFSRNTIPLSS